MKFKCKLCDQHFESAEHRPMCPQGCSLDRSEVTRPGDFSTTVRLRSDADEPAKPVKKRGRRRKIAGKKEDAGKKAEEPAKEPVAVAGAGVFRDSTEIFQELARAEAELPKNKAPVTQDSSEVQENKAHSLDSGEII